MHASKKLCIYQSIQSTSYYILTPKADYILLYTYICGPKSNKFGDSIHPTTTHVPLAEIGKKHNIPTKNALYNKSADAVTH